MAITGNKVTKPGLDPVEISNIMGFSTGDWGALCRSGKINKWAKFKPVRFRKVNELTEQELLSTNMGLVPSRNTLAESSADNDIKDIAGGWDAIVNGSTEWEYLVPTGTAASPFRISDFIGYVHNTQPPVIGFQTWKLRANAIKEVYVADRPSTSLPDATNFGESDSNYLSRIIGKERATYYSFLGMRWGEASGDNINHPDTNSIPITWLLGGVRTDYYRLVIGVKISDSLPMRFFSSRATLRDALNYRGASGTDSKATLIQPSLNTNQAACWEMIEACKFTGSNQPTSKTFKAVAFFAKDMVMSARTRNIQENTSDTAWSLCEVVKDQTQLFGMPTPAQEFEIEVLNNIGYTDDELGAMTRFSVYVESTGDYAHIGGNESWNQIPIRQLYIRLDDPFTGTLRYEITYSYVSGVNSDKSYNVKEVTKTGTWDVKRTDLQGKKINLAGGPGLTILSKTISIA